MENTATISLRQGAHLDTSRDARAERLARIRANRPQFGSEITIRADEVKSGDFLIRTGRFEWMYENGRTIYNARPLRFERIVEPGTTERFYSAAGVGVTFKGWGYAFPADLQVVVRRRIEK